MIITLKGADFTSSNIGTLSTWSVSRVLGMGATYSGARYVEKNANLNATVTLANGYELGAEGVVVTMGGTPLTSGITINGNVITITIASVTGNVVITVPTVNVGGGDVLDVATTAFINAASITDNTMITKLDTLVKSLKTANLWNKIEALYPCVGTTFTQMSYNLKDPTTYRLTCSGTPTIVANDSMYHATAHIKSDIPTRTGSDLHLMGCANTGIDEVAILCPTPSNGGGLSSGGVAFMLNRSSNQFVLRTATDNTWTAAYSGTNNGKGIYVGSLTTGIVYNGANTNATKTGNPSITNWVTDGRGFTHNGSNSSNDGSLNYPQKTRLSGFGHALTIEEMQTYSQILNTFKPMY